MSTKICQISIVITFRDDKQKQGYLNMSEEKALEIISLAIKRDDLWAMEITKRFIYYPTLEANND